MSIASEISRLQGAKADLETSIEAKGVNVPAGTLLDAYSGYVDLIQTGSSLDPLTNDAIAADILSGKEAYSDLSVAITGTMTNVGAQTESISTVAGTVTPTQGYHNGLGSISIDAAEQAKLISGNIKSGVTVLGVTGDSNVVDTSSGDAVAGEILSGKKAYVDGTELTGSMSNRAGDNSASSSSVASTTLKLVAPAGYYDGVDDTVTITDADFVAANIADGVDIFGVTGTLTGGGTPLTDAIVITSRNVNGYALTIDFYGSEVPIRAFYNYMPTYLSNYYYMTGIDWKTTVTAIKDFAFYYCADLALTALPSGVTSIGASAFYACTNLALTALPSGITTIGNYAFQNCAKLALTALPSDMTTIGNSVFSGCTNLALTALPSGITSISVYAFQNCTKLALTALPSDITSIGIYAFQNCTNLALTALPSGITSISNAAFVNCTKLALTALPVATTVVANKGFYGCTSLVTMDCPRLVTIAAATTTNGAFYGCTGLQTVTLGSVGYPVTDMGGAFVFQNCTQVGLVINVYVADPANPPTAVASTAPWGATNATINYLQA